MNIESLTLEELRASRPDLAEAIAAESKQGDEVLKLKAEKIALEAKLAEAAARDEKLKLEAIVKDELKAAKLDLENKTQVSDLFYGQLLEQKDGAKRLEMIKDRASLVSAAAANGNATEGKSSSGEKPVTSSGGGQATEGKSGANADITPEKFAKALLKR